MHHRIIAIALLTGSLLASHTLSAADSGQAPAIAFSSKFRNVDYLFTEHAERAAMDDGANYEIAIREVGWDLISAVGRACSSIHNIEGIFIDRIYFKERHALVVLGVLADLEFLPFNTEEAIATPALQALLDAFTREHITITQLADAKGVELSMSK
ncbi:hypothetical protein SAMN05192566_0098 [Methylophilus rhizosphaerae]|uniref:Uncharacterized protein n=1 Tax=Methylophilus rhizosphaerae TaxID=492660 RepID=A0A1G8Z515_9PROT|nr:hypothetical protein [Methylophilus rhizosphaerae]SDK10191.1 hypothetical protein SAMN05192566_0098 [Methylophilus rhizosphaerae]